MSVVSVSMPETLLDRIDRFASDHGYSGRSEVLREAARGLLEEFDAADRNSDAQSPHRTCTVTVVYDYCETAVQRRLTELRHEHDSLVTGTTHAHVDDRYCLEVFVLVGPVDAIGGFVHTVRSVPAVRRVDYSIASLRAGSSALSLET
ncbi:CopG family ribbon-helix-helix protein [Halopiger xanaduensis]|uniref:Putative nickel-responsive regulator n=1 Tax=Halopiger xanaduensis (strain DSM 18323 / JCM 14033 / SH-6) TaxID=797210 RepID=F8D885_HALXS|nr:CopG family ribbon-helix-helix protein [Halopiger xanaduensis]AEH36661.1 transcriptional regulator NikR, CopG family [Halopiger xanaduensis SH-6]